MISVKLNNLPVKYTCYDAQKHLISVQWVPNSHYSGVYGLVKLLIPDILPPTLNQVIALDSDLTFLCDVAELWSLLRNMTKEQVMSRYYKCHDFKNIYYRLFPH